jgi:nucleoside-diphosphate-sugar epimerase
MIDFLVTGASGFVGSAIVNCARHAGYRVRGTGRTPAALAAGADYVPMDLTQSDGLSRIVRDVHTVIHVAGVTPASDRRRTNNCAFYDTNAVLTESVLGAAIAAEVRHFILLSSVAVYGQQGASPCRETAPCLAADAYGLSKYLSEQVSMRLTAGTRTRLTVLRLGTTYGEGDHGNVFRLIRCIDRGRFIWIGRGTNLKSFIHREDVACACVAASQGLPDEPEVYNVVSPPCAVRAVVDAIATALGRPVPGWRLPASLTLRLTRAATFATGGWAPAAALHAGLSKWLADNVYDGNKFGHRFDWEPRVTLTEGLSREVAWYKTAVG